MVDQAEIHRKVASGDVGERGEGLGQLYSNFADLPDKDEAWEDLIRLTQRDHRWVVRCWHNIKYWLTEDKKGHVRGMAAYALGTAFQHVPDKDAAWKDLIRLTEDKKCDVGWVVASKLGIAFPHVPDKDAAWKDLIRLTKDKKDDVGWCAADALGTAFPHVPDKDAAWKDLIRLTRDKKYDVLWFAAYALGTAFPHVPDKDAAWKDLIQLTGDKKDDVCWGAADALGSAFPHVPDKDAAWKDLIWLTGDTNSMTRVGAADVLGIAFPHVSDMDEAWKDLIRLTGDKKSDVRTSANHSLGRASIFKATVAESEGDFESELNNAIDFFERSSNEKTYFNPSSFCLPFYRSFYTIAFKKTESEGELQRYLADAKSASEGSKNKETLLEAVENLANALTEAHKARDFSAMKSDLNTYRQYCDRAADLIGDAASRAPVAAGILRRGMPIIGDRIRDIQEKAKALCRETRGTGTPYEPLGIEVNKLATELSDRDDLQNERIASIISDNLGKFCNLLPEGEREYLCKIVEDLRDESEPDNKLIYIGMALSYLLPSIKSEIQNAAKSMIDEMKSDEQRSEKTGHSTTVFVGAGSTVVVPHTETESGDVTVTTAVTEESQPDKQPDRSSKRTAIKIFADVAVHVLVYTVLHHYLEELMPIIAPILVFSALIILLLIIRKAKSR